MSQSAVTVVTPIIAPFIVYRSLTLCKVSTVYADLIFNNVVSYGETLPLSAFTIILIE